MTQIALAEFIDRNRDELIARCRSKAGDPSDLTAADTTSQGVPLFLDQLVGELQGSSSMTREIRKGAIAHGQTLFFEGFTVSQVVHVYGNICQSVTDLVVDLDAPIEATEFRVLNRCLDDAIASAVSEYTHQQRVADDSTTREVVTMLEMAVTLLDAIQTGMIGAKGTSGALLLRTLVTARTRLESQMIPSAGPR